MDTEMENLITNDWKFLENIYNILSKGKVFELNDNDKIIEFVQPNELKKLINIRIENDQKLGTEDLVELCEQVIKYSVKTNHPRFYNQLFAQMDVYGLAGAWISEALNTSAYTFEVAPVFSLMETEIMNKICQILGYENGDGIFSPGGSISNMYALVLARYKAIPDIKEKGLFGMRPLVLFTSEESHYSFKKGAHWLGIGTENYVLVKTNELGQMEAEDLDRKIQHAKNENKIPFFVNATAGTTVLGAFDDLQEISKICEKHKLWLHVDACHGGAVMLSENNKFLIKGIEKSNSVAWNPHKAIGAPLQCALFLTREKQILRECNSTDANYLFQQDKFYDVAYDTGNKSIQCGRKIDALKLWLMFKARGLSAYGILVDNSIEMAKLLTMKIKLRPGFLLLQNEFQYTNVCFWYIPKVMRDQQRNDEWYKKLYMVAPQIKEKMVKTGKLMIGYSPLGYRNIGNFLRMVFTSFPMITENELTFILDEVEKLGEECLC